MRFREKGSYLILPFEKFPCTIVSCSSQSASSLKIRMTPTLVCIILLTELSSGIPVKSPMQISTQAMLRKPQDSAFEGHRLSERVERSTTSVAGGGGGGEIWKVDRRGPHFIHLNWFFVYSQAAISWRASGDHQISFNASAERVFPNFRDKKHCILQLQFFATKTLFLHIFATKPFFYKFCNKKL